MAPSSGKRKVTKKKRNKQTQLFPALLGQNVNGNIHVPFPAGRPMMVAGPTGCGKTCWVEKLLSNSNNFTEPVRHILYCYGVYQPRFTEMKKRLSNITFHSGLPSKDTVKQFDNHYHLDVIVLDDLMEKILDNVSAQALFTKYCHHYNISTIFITQNVMAQGRCARNISLNTLILVVFQNHRDKNQALSLAKQQSPRNPDLFLQAFEDATNSPHGYLVVDCTPQCNNTKRWRTEIFKDEGLGKLGGKCYRVCNRSIFVSPITDSHKVVQKKRK